MDEVDELLSEGSNPEAVALAASPPIEEIYSSSLQAGIVDELRTLVLGNG